MFKFAICFTPWRPKWTPGPNAPEPSVCGFEIQVHERAGQYWTKWFQVTDQGFFYEDEDATPAQDVEHLVQRLVDYIEHLGENVWEYQEPTELAFVLSEQRPRTPSGLNPNADPVPGTEYVLFPNGERWDLITTHVSGDCFGWRNWIAEAFGSLEQAVAVLVVSHMLVDDQTATGDSEEVPDV